jgi:predicted Zn-dependent protease
VRESEKTAASAPEVRPRGRYNRTYMDRIAGLLDILTGNPEDTFARYALGMEYSRAGRVDDAVSEFRTLIGKQPDYANAYFMAAQALAAAERVPEARTFLQEGISAANRARNQHAAGEMQAMLDELEYR